MSDAKALLKLAGSLQMTIDKMTTQAAHQSLFLRMLGEECETHEQEALLFALTSSNTAGFDYRVEVDRQMGELIARIAALEVPNV